MTMTSPLNSTKFIKWLGEEAPVIARIYTVVICFLALCNGASAADDVCNLKVATVLDARSSDDGRLFVPARFGGYATYLQVHTGSSWNFVESLLVDTLKLPRKPLRTITFVNALGDKFKDYVSVPQFKLGTLAFAGETDFIIEASDGDIDTSKYGGTLGIGMLSSYDVEIDNTAKRVTLWRPDIFCSGRLVRWAETWTEIRFDLNNEIPILRVQVNGENLRASVNTATTYSSMDLDTARNRFGITPQSPGVRQVRDGVYMYTFNTLNVSGLTFTNVEVVLRDFQDLQFSLGMNVLKQLHLYFAFKRKIIYATRIDPAR